MVELNLKWKENEEVVNVCQAWEEMREDARKMLQKGTYSKEEISELSGLTIEEVETLAESNENL